MAKELTKMDRMPQIKTAIIPEAGLSETITHTHLNRVKINELVQVVNDLIAENAGLKKQIEELATRFK